MKRELGLSSIEHDSTSLVTVGAYDGIHAGHQAILRYLLRKAQQQGCPSTLLTFDPHPQEVIKGKKMPLLTTTEEKIAYLEALGLDRLVIVEFTPAFARLTPEQFVTDILVNRIGLREIVVGYDHRFGRGRQGDVNLLRQMGTQHGFTVDMLTAQFVQKHIVSSSRIRRLLTEEGEVQEVATMLRRPYSLKGKVVHGASRGRSIGFPTANIRVIDNRKVIPLRGVYAVRVQVQGDRCEYGGMMNIGLRPTVDNTNRLTVEVHIFDFFRDIYGQEIQVFFVCRVRPEKKFASLQDLTVRLHRDERQIRTLLELVSPPAC